MEQNSAVRQRYPALYRHDLLNWRRKELGWSIQETARRCGENFETTRMVFHGRAMNRKAFSVCLVLGLEWDKIHNLNLEEIDFHLAVTNGSGTSHSAG